MWSSYLWKVDVNWRAHFDRFQFTKQKEIGFTYKISPVQVGTTVYSSHHFQVELLAVVSVHK